MKKKSLICFLIFVLVAVFSTYGFSYADTKADKQQELNDVKEQAKEVKSDMQELVSKIEDQQAQIDKIQNSIDEKEAEIEKAEADIAQTVKDIKERENGLNKRLRTMYKNGSVGYLDVLLGSNSISEFISNLEMIQRIYKNDQNTLVVLEEQQKELEEKQAVLEREQKELGEKKSEAQEKKDALKEDQTALQEKLDELNAEAERIGDEIASMQDQNKVYEGGKFMWPTTSTYITSPFGFRIHPVTGYYTGHTGVDIGASYGSPVYAAADGTVIVASNSYGGYGVAVVIDHGSGISTLYGHNDHVEVSVGQHVKRGQIVAYSGNSGVSTGPHLHFEVRINGSYVDPMSYF